MDTGKSAHSDEDASRRRALIAVIFSANILYGLLNGALAPIVPAMAQHFGGDGILLSQLVIAVAQFGIVLGGLPAGRLADRFGPRPVLLGSLAAFAGIGSAGLYLDDTVALLASRLLLGIASVGITSSCLALIGSRIAPDRRPRLIGYQTGIGAGAGVFVLLLTGFVGQSAGWRAPFAFYLVSLVVLALAWYGVPRGAAAPVQQRVDAASLAAALPALLTQLPVYLLLMLLAVVQVSVFLQLPFLVTQEGLGDLRQVSVVASVGAAAMAIGAASYGRIQTIVPHGVIPPLVLAGLALGQFALFSASSLANVVVGTLLAEFCAGVLIPHGYALIVARSPADVRATTLAVGASFLSLGNALNPLLAAPLRVELGIRGFFAAMGAFLLAIVLVLVIVTYSRRRAPVESAAQ